MASIIVSSLDFTFLEGNFKSLQLDYKLFCEGSPLVEVFINWKYRRVVKFTSVSNGEQVESETELPSPLEESLIRKSLITGFTSSILKGRAPITTTLKIAQAESGIKNLCLLEFQLLLISSYKDIFKKHSFELV